ncbi:MAG: sigma 54-interacting transcriptional regulator [Deltaproteobacteria bacterium]|nr:sigma 54-interacting transcriptional regulator [Deltaproteobacteria bacterium]
MALQLNFCKNNRSFFRINLKASSLTIGRSASSDVVLPDSDISREHAIVYQMDSQWIIKRVGTSKLTINGKNKAIHVLQVNDEICLGQWKAELLEAPEILSHLETTVGIKPKSSHTQILQHSSQGILFNKPELQIFQPSQKSQNIPINSESITIGSAPQNDIVLKDPYISSRHLKVAIQGEDVWIYDLGSTNGTYVDGVQIREAKFTPNMKLKLGQCQITLSNKQSIQPVAELEQEEFCGIIGASPQMKKLYSLLNKIGPTEATVLVLGESGSGKELVARAVHQLSPRSSGPFIAINCGAISKELIESELFGHEKGAFTGAEKRHEGAFGQASGGTLFLDEIGELPLDLQPKLLRILENGTYRRVGGQEELQANVRVVAATHRDLAKLVKEKRFREDLFFRLFVLPIQIPPLRERLGDLELLVEAFLEEFSPEGSSKKIHPEAMEKLQKNSYPGNVRELRNVLLRSVILSHDHEICAEDILFPQEALKVTKPEVALEKLEAMEKRLIQQTLKKCNWNKTLAAKSLGIAKSTLFTKIRLYELEDPIKEN